MFPYKWIYALPRFLLFRTRRLVLVLFILAVAMVMIVTYNIMGLHLSWQHPSQIHRIPSPDHHGALLREEYQKIPFTFYDSPEMDHLRPMLDPYIHQITKLRQKLLQKPYIRSAIPNDWILINGYNTKYFDLVKGIRGVHTVYLTGDIEKSHSHLPVQEFYNFGGTEFGCKRMTAKCWAIYNNGDVLLNKTCQTNLTKTLIAHPVDRTLLGVGLPSPPDNSKSHLPGKDIFTFINLIENAVISKNGEVFVQNVCIKTQRCTSDWYDIKQDDNLDLLPFYEEVLSITEQTQVWYYHSTIEDLTRISPYLLFLRDNPSVMLHITKADFHIKMLTFLGIDKKRILWGGVRAKILYLPAGTACGRPAAFNTGLLSLLFHQRVAARLGKIKRDRIVILHRSDKNRQFIHHDDIVTMVTEEAAPYNLIVEVFRDDPLPSFESYVELFQRAKVIISPHGAGLSNQVFSQPGTVVIEGLCYMEPKHFFCFLGYIPWLCHRDTSRFSLSFRNLATMLGNHYHGIVREDDCLNVQPDDLRDALQFYLHHLANASPTRSHTVNE